MAKTDCPNRIRVVLAEKESNSPLACYSNGRYRHYCVKMENEQDSTIYGAVC